MADVGSLVFDISADSSGLKTAINDAVSSLEKLGHSGTNLTKRLKQVNAALAGGKPVYAQLEKLGLDTTKRLKEEIAAWEEIAKAVPEADVAYGQIQARIAGLKGRLEGYGKATEGAAGGTDRMANAQHRANLFALNLSRGLEDLKFGLPAVINNIDAVAFSFSLMQRDMKEANATTSDVWKAMLKSPAGIIAIMNGLITLGFLFGDTLVRAISRATSSVKNLKQAFTKAVDVSYRDFEGEFAIDSLYAATVALNKYNQELSNAGAAAYKLKAIINAIGSTGILGDDIFPEARGGVGEAVRRFAGDIGLLGDRLQALGVSQPELDDIVKQFRAAAIQAEVLQVVLAGTRLPGSINRLEHELQGLEIQFGRVTDAAGRRGLQKEINDLNAKIGLAKAAAQGGYESLAGLSGIMDVVSSRMEQATTPTERAARGFEYVEDKVQQLQQTLETKVEGSIEQTAASIAKWSFYADNARNATERMNAGMLTIADSAKQMRQELEKLERIPESLAYASKSLEILDEDFKNAPGPIERAAAAAELLNWQFIEMGINAERHLSGSLGRLSAEISNWDAYINEATNSWDRLDGEMQKANATAEKLRKEFDSALPGSLQKADRWLKILQHDLETASSAAERNDIRIDIELGEYQQQLEELAIEPTRRWLQEMISVKQTMTTLEFDALNDVSSALGDNISKMITLQGGLEDLGKSIVQVFQKIVAQIVTQVIKEQLLIALGYKKISAAVQALAIEKQITAELRQQAIYSSGYRSGGGGGAGGNLVSDIVGGVSDVVTSSIGKAGSATAGQAAVNAGASSAVASGTGESAALAVESQTAAQAGGWLGSGMTAAAVTLAVYAVTTSVLSRIQRRNLDLSRTGISTGPGTALTYYGGTLTAPDGSPASRRNLTPEGWDIPWWRPPQLQIQPAVLRSGDILFSVDEARAVQSKTLG